MAESLMNKWPSDLGKCCFDKICLSRQVFAMNVTLLRYKRTVNKTLLF